MKKFMVESEVFFCTGPMTKLDQVKIYLLTVMRVYDII